MKKFIFAAFAVALSASAALAENPHVGEPANLYANDRTPVTVFVVKGLDYTDTASINAPTAPINASGYPTDGSAHRFSDNSPSSYQE
ncbi:hypothetical protein G3A39_42645 [Paraburkholderia aspalathi]|nr:hypothetical protein [Paraburkholderia aspalathi]